MGGGGQGAAVFVAVGFPSRMPNSIEMRKLLIRQSDLKCPYLVLESGYK